MRTVAIIIGGSFMAIAFSLGHPIIIIAAFALGYKLLCWGAD